MEQAVEKLNVMLRNECSGILDVLEELAIASQDATPDELAEYDLDDILVSSFGRICKEEHARFVILLSDLVSYMRDPRNIYSSIQTYFGPECAFSMEVAKVVCIMRRSFNFEFDDFFCNLFNCLIPTSIEKDPERTLFFVLTVFEDKNIPLRVVRPFVKKLCNISLQMSSAHCQKTLWTVLWIMRLHPMAYAMARRESFNRQLEWSTSITMDEFQPYLFELDVLGESLSGIRRIVGAIKSEALDVKNRPRFVSLVNFTFPDIEDTQ